MAVTLSKKSLVIFGLLVWTFGQNTVKCLSNNENTKAIYMEIEHLHDVISELRQDVKRLQKSHNDQDGQTALNTIAFTAKSTEDEFYNEGDILQYPNVLTNVGNAYDPGTGIFKCTVTGTYMFSATVFTADNRLHVRMMKNTEALFNGDTRDWSQGIAGIVVIECNAEDTVWIEAAVDNQQVYSSARNCFTGVLLSIV